MWSCVCVCVCVWSCVCVCSADIGREFVDCLHVSDHTYRVHLISGWYCIIPPKRKRARIGPLLGSPRCIYFAVGVRNSRQTFIIYGTRSKLLTTTENAIEASARHFVRTHLRFISDPSKSVPGQFRCFNSRHWCVIQHLLMLHRVEYLTFDPFDERAFQE